MEKYKRYSLENEKSDLYDVLAYIAFDSIPCSREERANNAKKTIENIYADHQKEFINFVLDQYINEGVSELSSKKLPHLINMKYGTPTDAERQLGEIPNIQKTFNEFQQHLYAA